MILSGFSEIKKSWLLIMIVCVEYISLFTASIIRILDISTKAWYILAEPYSSEALYISSIVALFAPLVFFLTLYVIFLVKQLITSALSNFKPLPMFLFIIGDLIGVSYLGIATILACNKVSLRDLENYGKLLRLAAVVDSTFQSGPIIIIQIFNNHSNNSWGPVIIFSIATTAAWLCFTCLKLIFSNDENTTMTKAQVFAFDKVCEIKYTEGNFKKIQSEDDQNENAMEAVNLDISDI